MLNCSSCEELISAYIEGELTKERKQSFDRHIKLCQSCAKKIHHVKLLKNNLNSLPTLSVSSEFDTILRAQITLERRNESRKQRKSVFSLPALKPVYGFSLGAALLALIIIIFSTSFDRTDEIPLASRSQERQELERIREQDKQDAELTVYSAVDRKKVDELLHKEKSNIYTPYTEVDSTEFKADIKNVSNTNKNIYRISF